MNIMKLEHSGFCLTKGHDCVVIDPVEFTTKLPIFGDIVAIVITHKHNDHCQPDIINKLRLEAPNAPIFTTTDTVPLIPGAIAVKPGESREVGTFRLQFFGKSHAAIVEGQIPCENLGVVVDGLFATPGDSFDTPPVSVKALAVPISGPWCKVTESIKYVKDTKPALVIPAHDAFLSDLGREFSNSWLKFACESFGLKFTPLAPGAAIEVESGS